MQYYSIKDACEFLGVYRHFLLKYFPRPQHGAGQRKTYTLAEVRSFKTEMDAWPDEEHVHEKGYYDHAHAADYLEMPRATWHWWKINKQIPMPTHNYGRKSYYVKEELDAIREANPEYFNKYMHGIKSAKNNQRTERTDSQDGRTPITSRGASTGKVPQTERIRLEPFRRDVGAGREKAGTDNGAPGAAQRSTRNDNNKVD